MWERTVADLEIESIRVKDFLGSGFQHIKVDIGSVDPLG